MSPEQTPSDAKLAAASECIHGQGLSRKPQFLEIWSSDYSFILTFFAFRRQWPGAKPNTPFDNVLRVTNFLNYFGSFIWLFIAGRFTTLADRSLFVSSRSHGVPRLHLTVLAGHPIDTTGPLSIPDTTQDHWINATGPICADIPRPSPHGHQLLPAPEPRLQPYLDSTTTAFDTIFKYSISITLAHSTTSSLSNTITFSTDATDTVTSATTTSDHDDSSTLSHNPTKVTFLHASTFRVANSERLSRPHLRDPSHAPLET